LNLSAHGAVIVSGSQAHLPQGMTFVGDHFVHYGLGNLFFDQMDIPVVGTRREFLDRHVIYDGKYIQTELITAMLEDYARPRLMTEEERQLFLTDIFTASGWMQAEEEK
jgi:poly-gamma-glutamate synthesis protein (capsule biosynthesis protein)